MHRLVSTACKGSMSQFVPAHPGSLHRLGKGQHLEAQQLIGYTEPAHARPATAYVSNTTCEGACAHHVQLYGTSILDKVTHSRARTSGVPIAHRRKPPRSSRGCGIAAFAVSTPTATASASTSTAPHMITLLVIELCFECTYMSFACKAQYKHAQFGSRVSQSLCNSCVARS